ncbi:MAG: hypothetical protein IJN82_07335, partial [Clostridia bacterium]|nr:hypothetical protein [Clostridia bacterium]
LDHQGSVARKNGAKLIRDRIEALRERFPGIMTFAAGDYNTTEYTEAYNILSTDGMADARYIAEVTDNINTHGSPETEADYLATGASSKIDFIMTFEDAVNISKFQTLDECIAGYRLSDHNGLLATFTPSGSVNFGGVAGVNSGEIERGFSFPYIMGGNQTGAIVGQNKGTLNDAYYYDFGAEDAPVGKGDDEGAIYEEEFALELMWNLNQKVGKNVYTVDDAEYPALVNESRAIPVCLTVNGVPTYLLSGTEYKPDVSAYTEPICAMDGIYIEGTTITVPAYDAVVTIREAVECGESCTGQWIVIDENTHRWVCDANASHYEVSEHNWVDAEDVAADCENEGYKLQICSDCKVEKRGDTLEAIGHAWGEFKPYDETDHYRICANDPEHLDYMPHNFDDGVYVDETCISMSYTRYTCSECGYYYDVYLEPATSHSWGDWEYTDEATHTHTCIYEASHTESEPHTYEATEQAPTCDVGGGTV